MGVVGHLPPPRPPQLPWMLPTVNVGDTATPPRYRTRVTPPRLFFYLRRCSFWRICCAPMQRPFWYELRMSSLLTIANILNSQ